MNSTQEARWENPTKKAAFGMKYEEGASELSGKKEVREQEDWT